MENSLILEYCKNYNNWCEKEKRTCKNCYYENTKDKEEIKTMVEEIEEKLKEYYEFLTIEVEYAKIKTYKIFISITLTDYRNSDVIKGVEFYYNWEDHLTFTANIEQMRYNIEKAIIKFFRKEAIT